MIKRLLIALVLVGIITGAGLALYARDQLTSPLALSEATLYQVEDGASLKRVLNDFANRDWISEPRIHEIWLRLTDQTAIQRGEYRLQPDESPSDAIARMVAGDKVLRSVQFIEGWNFRQIRAALMLQEHLQQTLPSLSDQAVAELLGIEQSNPEGWFFPDTSCLSVAWPMLRFCGVLTRKCKLNWNAPGPCAPMTGPSKHLMKR